MDEGTRLFGPRSLETESCQLDREGIAVSDGGAIEPHYSLEEAAKRFFPGGVITGRSLRTEINKGFLPRKNVAGKLVTCASDIARMLELKQCHKEQRGSASTSRSHTARDVLTGSSRMDRSASARAAALMTSKELEKLSRAT